MKTGKNILITISALILIMLAFPSGLVLAADNTEPLARPVIPKIRGMGGAYTAVAAGESTVFYNPAGYGAQKESITSVFSLSIKANVDTPALNVYGGIISGVNVFAPGNLTTYFNNTTLALGVGGPVFFARVGNNFGFAFYDNVSSILDTRPGGFTPFAEYTAYGDLGFIGGYGMELPFLKNFYTGINLKVILRSKIEKSGTMLEVMSMAMDTSQAPIAKSIGFGADFGLLYRPVPVFSVGVAFTDFFGTGFSNWQMLSQTQEEDYPNSYIKPRIPFGIAVYPLTASGESKNFKNLIIAVDYSDLLDYSSPFSNIKFGLSFSTLRVMEIYGGFDGGYLTGGLGLNFKVYHMHFIYYVDELGAYPGANPAQNVLINFEFKW
ncbi:MAG TPA: hypothetical protein ENI15_19030 [Spirochaetes bacterium]|nr:hypothetical protein [Spirochaetota bacterium]